MTGKHFVSGLSMICWPKGCFLFKMLALAIEEKGRRKHREKDGDIT